MKLALKVKLSIDEAEIPRLIKTFDAWAFAWQTVAHWGFTNKCRSQMLAQKETYYYVRKMMPELSANLVQSARTDALAKLRICKFKSEPKLKHKTLRYDTRTCSVKKDTMTLALCGGKRITAKMQLYPRFTEFRAKYKLLSPVIYLRGKTLWASFVFEIPEADHHSQNKDVTGIDLGQRNLAVTSDGRFFKGKKLNFSRRKIRFLKRKLQHRGTKSARRKLRGLGIKEKRQSDNAIHCLTKHILTTTASSHLAIEKLKFKTPTFKFGNKNKNRRKYAIPLGKFATFLRYKAPLFGKTVVEVSPYLTSQQDCRGLANGERKGGNYIGIDGKILNADLNAACNIAWKAKERYALNNPILAKNYNRQAVVTQPIACKPSSISESCKLSA
jgi:putative transposase